MPLTRASPIIILAQSAVAVSTTGDTNENTLATITIPGGIIGANGRVEVEAVWTYTNSATGKALRIKFGGTNFVSFATTTSASCRTPTVICNRNNVSSQIGFAASSTGGVATSTAAPATAAVNTNNDVALLITGQNGLASETITLESYIVKVFPKP